MIPGGATLIFEVELINISNSPPSKNVFKDIDDNKDNMLSREEVNQYVCMEKIYFIIFLIIFPF